MTDDLRWKDRRVAPWYRAHEPVVVRVDEHMATTMRAVPFLPGLPSAPGYWWGADGRWHGPHDTAGAARAEGRRALAGR